MSKGYDAKTVFNALMDSAGKEPAAKTALPGARERVFWEVIGWCALLLRCVCLEGPACNVMQSVCCWEREAVELREAYSVRLLALNHKVIVVPERVKKY